MNDVCLQKPRGILLIVSNPVDVLTYATWKWSGLPAHRVIGSGTSLDTSRFRRRLAEHYGVASANVRAYVIGEHGDTQIPVLSSARVAGLTLNKLSNQLGMPHAKSLLARIADQTRTAGGDIIDAKGATYYGIGAALIRAGCTQPLRAEGARSVCRSCQKEHRRLIPNDTDLTSVGISYKATLPSSSSSPTNWLATRDIKLCHGHCAAGPRTCDGTLSAG